jgi:hypothetical protein
VTHRSATARQSLACLSSEEQREDTQTFGESHTDDGLNEDLTRCAGIATDRFNGLEANESYADCGAEETETASDVSGDFSYEHDV